MDNSTKSTPLSVAGALNGAPKSGDRSPSRPILSLTTPRTVVMEPAAQAAAQAARSTAGDWKLSGQRPSSPATAPSAAKAVMLPVAVEAEPQPAPAPAPAPRKRKHRALTPAQKALAQKAVQPARCIFPALFDPRRVVPWAVGAVAQLNEALTALGWPPATVDALLIYWTQRDAYLEAVASGGPRYGLDGQPSGEVAPSESLWAQTRLGYRRAGSRRVPPESKSPRSDARTFNSTKSVEQPTGLVLQAQTESARHE